MKDDIYDLAFQQEEAYWWYVARRRILLDCVRALLPKQSAGSKSDILEYGCGTGCTLSSLSGCADVYGMDASPKALDYCRKRGLTRLHRIDAQQPLPEANPFHASFDLILLLDVLEHLDDEIAVLQILRAWLKPGGSLIVSVPAFPCLWSGEDVVSHHRRRYTKKSLRRTLRRAGFHTVRETYFNFFLFPLQASAILANRLFRPHALTQSNLKPLPLRLNSLLTWIMSSERCALKFVNLPAGGSVLSIAKPS
ncbi:MAG: class I SAM-dependent methyltransferase [Candidatus Omnitrophica bacterium]|nr:class I SAM-dependent methyltransferase [Candidatus Omnitrophota bacterium]